MKRMEVTRAEHCGATIDLFDSGTKAPRFDYDQVDVGVASELRAAAIEIRRHLVDQRISIIETGKRLIAAKAMLTHGAFGKWLEAEFRLSIRSAQSYMQSASVYGDEYATVAYLPVKTLNQLASPCVAEVRKEIFNRSAAGERLAVNDVEAKIAAAKAAHAEQRRLEKLSADERESERKKALARQRRTERSKIDWDKQRQERQAIHDAKEAAAQAAIAMLVTMGPDRFREFRSYVKAADGWCFIQALDRTAHLQDQTVASAGTCIEVTEAEPVGDEYPDWERQVDIDDLEDELRLEKTQILSELARDEFRSPFERLSSDQKEALEEEFSEVIAKGSRDCGGMLQVFVKNYEDIQQKLVRKRKGQR